MDLSVKLKTVGVIALGIVILASAVAFVFLTSSSGKTVLKVFHAGSLSEVFLEFEERFEETHDGVDIQRESAGSVDTIRKVTDLGKKADVVASADYKLIQTMMIEPEPAFADFYIQFARNRLVVAYTDASAYGTEVNGTNWFDIMRKGDVTIGFADPNSDPCGYRSLIVIQLSEMHYGDADIFEDLVSDHSSISSAEDGGNYTISAPTAINPDSTIMVRPKEVDLMALLEAGELDYLFIYKSVAYQHRDSGVFFLELPEETDLGAVEHASTYEKVSVIRNSDRPDKARETRASPIVYGLTIPDDAENPELALEFVKLVIGDEGSDVLESLGQPPMVPSRTNDLQAVPEELRELVIEE